MFSSSYSQVVKECDSKSVANLSEQVRILLAALCTDKKSRFLNLNIHVAWKYNSYFLQIFF